MEEKQINKWLRRQFSPLGWALLGYYGLMNIFVFLTLALDTAAQLLRSFATGNFLDGLDVEALMGNAWGYAAAIAVVFVILYSWKGWDYRRILLAKERRMTFGTLLCMVCLCCGAQFANSLWVMLVEAVANFFGGSIMGLVESVSGASNTFSMFLYASILAPIAEEVIFRGYVLRVLQPYGKRFAILGSAALFGIFHGNLLQTPYAFLVGLVLGYVTVEYSMFWAILLHVFNNLVLADGLTRLMERMSPEMANLVSLGVFGGCAVLSAGILIAKRQKIREYRQGDWIDRRCLKCFFLNAGVLLLTICMLCNMLLTLSA